VGERSYGDAGVRRAITMDDGSAVILSVAKYYSPAGKAIQDTGVTPTTMVSEIEPVVDTDDDDNNPPQPEPKKEEDSILKKAVELLTKGKAEAAAPAPAAAKPATGPPSSEIPPLVDKNEKKK
jgi:carboxyl-terminal processing protease